MPSMTDAKPGPIKQRQVLARGGSIKDVGKQPNAPRLDLGATTTPVPRGDVDGGTTVDRDERGSPNADVLGDHERGVGRPAPRGGGRMPGQAMPDHGKHR